MVVDIPTLIAHEYIKRMVNECMQCPTLIAEAEQGFESWRDSLEYSGVGAESLEQFKRQAALGCAMRRIIKSVPLN